MIKIGTFYNIIDDKWQENNEPLLKESFDYFELMPENEEVYSLETIIKIFGQREVIIHAPFVEANLISNSEHIRRSSFEYYKYRLSPLVKHFEAKVVTFHLGYTAFYYKNIVFDQFKKLSALFPQLAIENMPANKNIWKVAYPSTENEFDDLLSKIDSKITFDVGHWFKQEYDIYKLVKKYSNRIINIHIHDIIDGKDHQPLGTGSLDVEKFISTLKDIGYQGYLSIELISDDIKGTLSSFKLLKNLLS